MAASPSPSAASWMQLSLVLLMLMMLNSTGWCNNLTCYWCVADSDLSPCYYNVSIVPTKMCRGNEDQCSVYRENLNGKLSLIRRDCNASCRAVCGTWGDDMDEDRCSSCCNTSLCNTDSSAKSLWGASLWATMPTGFQTFRDTVFKLGPLCLKDLLASTSGYCSVQFLWNFLSVATFLTVFQVWIK